jgi:large subunit ribosomal protein L24
MKRIRQGDEVIVIAGKDKGRRGNVTRVLPDGKVIVENLNVAKKHQRPNPQRGQAGGIVEMERPLDPSNVMIFNATTAKGDRVGYRKLQDGRKVRFFRSNGEVLDR